MTGFVSAYEAKTPNADGYVDYTASEQDVWCQLYERQIELMPGRACNGFLTGLKRLSIRANEIPQTVEVNKVMNSITGWGVEPVAALISPREFFELLARRRFPAATFIRMPEDLNYVKEPDIFHEIFGHCPLLTDPVFAKFVEDYGKMVLTMDESEWPLLQRLFWFTVEFGLLQTPEGVRSYGGGILSSIEETVYAVDSDIPLRKPFDVIDVFRTPYRIDRLQPIYFIIESYEQLYDIVHCDTSALLKQAHALGEHPPLFEVDGSVNEHINWC